jgi:hypothetical protein
VNLDRATSAPALGTTKKELRCRECGYLAIVSGRLPSCPMCQATAWHELDRTPTARPFAASAADHSRVRPTWEAVEDVLAELSSTQASFSGLDGPTFRLERYHRDWRVWAVTEQSARWVEIEDIRTCWETFERLGRIQSEDVLDPGRCSSLMMALFERVPGIEQTAGNSASLTFL